MNNNNKLPEGWGDPTKAVNFAKEKPADIAESVETIEPEPQPQNEIEVSGSYMSQFSQTDSPNKSNMGIVAIVAALVVVVGCVGIFALMGGDGNERDNTVVTGGNTTQSVDVTPPTASSTELESTNQILTSQDLANTTWTGIDEKGEYFELAFNNYDEFYYIMYNPEGYYIFEGTFTISGAELNLMTTYVTVLCDDGVFAYCNELDGFEVLTLGNGYTILYDSVRLEKGETSGIWWFGRQVQTASHTEPSLSNTVIMDGDWVNIDYVGYIDGVEFDNSFDYGMDGFDVLAGSNMFIGDFLCQIIGLSPGDVVDIWVNFPNEYHPAPELSGKRALFVTTINYIIPD
jgi:hypothetical protein